MKPCWGLKFSCVIMLGDAPVIPLGVLVDRLLFYFPQVGRVSSGASACMLHALFRPFMRAFSTLSSYSPVLFLITTPLFFRSFSCSFTSPSFLFLLNPAPFSHAKIPEHQSLAVSSTCSSSAMPWLKFTFLSCCSEFIFLLPWGCCSRLRAVL